MNTCILRNKAFILIFFVFDSASVQAQEIKKLKDHNYWTVKNLSLDIGDSYCYNDSIQYCGKYGRLYTWSAAIKVCEHLGQGWHLPTSNEWINLLNHYGRAFQDSVNNGKKSFSRLLKQGKHRFNAMLGGNRNLDESYSRLEAHGFYWTTSEFDDLHAGFLNIANGRKVLYLQADMEKTERSQFVVLRLMASKPVAI